MIVFPKLRLVKVIQNYLPYSLGLPLKYLSISMLNRSEKNSLYLKAISGGFGETKQLYDLKLPLYLLDVNT